MPQRTHSKSLFHTLFLAAALSLLSAVVRRERRQQLKTARDRRKTTRVAPKRIALSVGFATLFFAGAAFSAGAGNTVVSLIDPSTESAADTTTTDTTVADAAPAPAPAPASSPTPSSEVVPASEPAAEPAAPEAPEVDRPDAPKAVSQPVVDNPSGGTVDSASRIRASFAKSASKRPGSSQASSVGGKTAVQTARVLHLQGPPVIKTQPQPLRKPVDREPEADEPNVAATVWLYRDLPDPRRRPAA